MAKGLDELPDSLTDHAPLLCGASHVRYRTTKMRFRASNTGPFVREVVSEDGPRHLGERTVASSPPLP
jgi:hypothetical protein